MVLLILAPSLATHAQTSQPKKVFMITDMEGVDGLVSCPDQCVPFTSPRWAESQKLLADEVNAYLYSGKDFLEAWLKQPL